VGVGKPFTEAAPDLQSIVSGMILDLERNLCRGFDGFRPTIHAGKIAFPVQDPENTQTSNIVAQPKQYSQAEAEVC
jgi:hypothetical protein